MFVLVGGVDFSSIWQYSTIFMPGRYHRGLLPVLWFGILLNTTRNGFVLLVLLWYRFCLHNNFLCGSVELGCVGIWTILLSALPLGRLTAVAVSFSLIQYHNNETPSVPCLWSIIPDHTTLLYTPASVPLACPASPIRAPEKAIAQFVPPMRPR